MRASAAVERAGVPTVSLTCEGFLGQAATTASGLGMGNLAVATVPGHVDAQSVEALHENLRAVSLDAVIAGLTRDAARAAVSADPDPAETLFSGDVDEVNRLFYENGWSDGLPIVPPTRERIDAFLRHTARAPDEVIGMLLPENRAATVWNVAVNGVMANCRPEYMPVLLAIVEAMADPAYGVEHSGDTTGGEALIILNGPLVKQLGFNDQQGALRDGVQANTSVGRFWRLYLRNVAGFLPGRGDKCTFGNTWRVALAENEAALAEINWPPLSADLGFPGGQNTATVARFTGGGVVGSIYGDTAEQVLPYLADGLTRQVSWELAFTVGLATGTSRPLLVLSPILARTLADSGLSKQDVKQRLYDLARIPAARFERYIGEWSNLVPGGRSLYDLANLGLAPPQFGDSDAPERLVPIVCAPADIMLAVSGDPLRANAYAFASNGMHGFPTTKPIVAAPDKG